MTTSDHPTLESIRTQLDRVDDPELDKSIVDLEYIHTLDINGSAVAVELVLPTAWCSPAFAWMMATDARDEIERLPSVTEATIRLADHMHAEAINRGVNERLRFETVFEDATEGIEAVRRTLDEKARMGRQYRAVETLLDAGLEPEQIVGLTRGDVTLDGKNEGDNTNSLNITASHLDRAAISLADGAFVVFVPAEPIATYLQKATDVGVVASPDDRLFVTSEGDPIPPHEFDRVHHRARLAETTVSGQGSICDGLNKARAGTTEEAN